ncbi:MAG: DUF5719 family protein [Acidimicrobiia bacterium]|nr:DUF5719 family protein [Acidimicrobiia bacterium]
MRRLLLLATAAAVGFVALLQTDAPEATVPEFSAAEDAVLEGAVASPSVWYCPWVEAGDVVDSDVILATEPDADVTVTLLDPLANAEPAEAEFGLIGPGATALSTGSVLRVGESPAIVELSNGPATVVSMSFTDGFVSADECVVSVPKIWYLTGGSTKTGTITRLRLFNPFADNAEVSITAYSEFGLDLVAELDGFDIAGRSWTTIDVGDYLEFRDELSFAITTNQGLVIPALVRSDDRGEGWWPGVAPADTWTFPIATAGDLASSVAVTSAGEEDVIVAVDIVTEDGTIRNAREVVLDAASPALIPLSDLAAPPFGLRVRATAPIAASVLAVAPEAEEEGGEGVADTATTVPDETTTTVSDDETTTTVIDEPFVAGLAGTVGSSRPSSEWIVPVDTIPGSETTLWILNPGTEPVSVDYQQLGEVEDPIRATIEVPAESTRGLAVEVGIGIYGYTVSASGPVSVGWDIVGDRGVALVSGIPVQ